MTQSPSTSSLHLTDLVKLRRQRSQSSNPDPTTVPTTPTIPTVRAKFPLGATSSGASTTCTPPSGDPEDVLQDNPDLQELFRQLARPTRPGLPYISKANAHQVRIRGLPAYSGDLQQTQLVRRVHQITRLLWQGDRLGYSVYRRKRRIGMPVEDCGMRISAKFVYTATWSYTPNADERDLVIGLSLDLGGNPPAWVDENRDEQGELTDQEVAYVRLLAIALVIDELQKGFLEAYIHAQETGTPADFYNYPPCPTRQEFHDQMNLLYVGKNPTSENPTSVAELDTSTNSSTNFAKSFVEAYTQVNYAPTPLTDQLTTHTAKVART